MIPGIDVSEFQGAIDWPAVRSAGYEFAFIRATIGGAGVDRSFTANWRAAQLAGLVRGAYHFAYPALNSPTAEADGFVDGVGALQSGDLLALDVETGGGDLRAWVAAWLARVAGRVGFRPLLYASPAFLSEHGPIGDPGDYGLWLADWQATMPRTPAGWPFIAVWQHSDAMTVPGIGPRVDGDFFNGPDLDHLRAYGAPGAITPGPPGPIPPGPPPPPSPVPPGRYVVRRGDTMSGIAVAAGCSLAQLEAANPHAGHPPGNFDLIVPGDVLTLPGGGHEPAPTPAPPHTYVVRGGDSLSRIAARLGVSLLALERLNPGLRRPPHNWNLLYPGDLVQLP